MQLNRFTDLGLRILITLILHNRKNKLSTVDVLAKELAVSRHHLVKIVHFMAQSNWIESYKGRNGGIRISEKTPELPLGDIIRALETASSECAFLINCYKPVCSLIDQCHLPSILNIAQQAFYRSLNHYKMKDLALSQIIFEVHAVEKLKPESYTETEQHRNESADPKQVKT